MEPLAHMVFQGHLFVPMSSLRHSVSMFSSYINQITDNHAEDGFDISPSEDERQIQTILRGTSKGKGASFHS